MMTYAMKNPKLLNSLPPTRLLGAKIFDIGDGERKFTHDICNGSSTEMNMDEMKTRDILSTYLVSKWSLCQLDHQRMFLPHHKRKLFRPLFARFAKLHVEVPKHLCENAAYLGVRQPRKEVGVSSL